MSKSISAAEVKTVIFACEAGMGSSLMSVNSLKKKLKAAQVADVTVIHKPVREIPATAQTSRHAQGRGTMEDHLAAMEEAVAANCDEESLDRP